MNHVNQEDLQRCEGIIQELIVSVKDLRKFVEQHPNELPMFIMFDPNKLETLMHLYNVKCPHFPCQTCVPQQHRICTWWIEKRLERKNACWYAKTRSRFTINKIITRKYLEIRNLIAECFAALEGGYGLPRYCQHHINKKKSLLRR